MSRHFIKTMCATAVLMLAVITSAAARGPLSSQFPLRDLHCEQTGLDPGKPLYVTPYINKGDTKTARSLAQVAPLPNATGSLAVESYAGYFTVNSTYNSNMFFWFFPAQVAPQNAPVLLWLQGGPGGSSMFGLFVENGPFSVLNMTLVPNKWAWTQKYSMLYIDNPVGTGFSYTDNDAGYATDEVDVAENLYSAVAQFFKLFPLLKNNDFYLSGESYAGKYIPALAHRIHSEPHPKQVLLRGIAIGDGFSDPPTMIHAYPDLLFNIGAMDENQRDYFSAQIRIIDHLLGQRQYKKAYQLLNDQYGELQKATGGIDMYNYQRMQIWDGVLNGDMTTGPSFYQKATGCSNYYNYAQCQSPSAFSAYNGFLQLPEVRRAIHVGNLTYNSGAKVEQMLVNDILQTVVPWLAEIMNYYKVLLYSGQYDIIVGAPLTELMLQSVPWIYNDEYQTADRQVWRVGPSDTEVAGYVRRVHDFYQVIVRGGGHILPFDQPERSFDMIDRFISGRPFA